MEYELVYVCDAAPGIGTGHLKRGLDVLRALRRRRPIRLALAGNHDPSLGRFIEEQLSAGVDRLSGELTTKAAVMVLDAMADPQAPGLVDSERASALRANCRTLVLVSSAIDVLVPESVDVLIDHMPDVKSTGATPSRSYLGVDYAPVSEEFAELERLPPDDCRTLLAVIGGNASQNGPTSVLDLAERKVAGLFERVELVVSPQYPADDLEDLHERASCIEILQNVPSLAERMAHSAAVLCTYGNVTWESLALGRPTFVWSYKRFQDEYAETLQRVGLVVNLGTFDSLREDRLRLLHSADVRASLARAAARVRGGGCGNIADSLLEELDRLERKPGRV